MPNHDLTDLLAAWPYEGGRINVREVGGLDGRAKIQIRVDLGVLQLESTGRPDGAQPEGPDGARMESLLHVHAARLRRHEVDRGASDGFVLTSEECASLREEAVQYYHRYVALFALEQFESVVRDTSRNLEVFDLCRRHGATEQDREVLEQFRAYVLMMRTRAMAAALVRQGDTRGAVNTIDGGIDEIRAAFAARGRLDQFGDSNEAQLLRGLRDMLVPKLPSSQRMELEERLRAAIASENYELAAILRDELRLME
ncbi:MAG: UvrB/UvrC motif-containing protein [Phycisphaerae bacterium]|nr:UvrB/UvrC motif-containing protein [Phycisphaerae bacterium]